MNHELSIEHELDGEQGMSDVQKVWVDTHDIPEGSYPQLISGQFVNALEVYPLRTAYKKTVSFRGKPYKWDQLEHDGPPEYLPANVTAST